MKTKIILIAALGIIVSSSLVYFFLEINEPKRPSDCRFKYGKGTQEMFECMKNFQDKVIIESFNNIQYGQFRDSDVHYERVDREKKYYGSMLDIDLVNETSKDSNKSSDSIRITFGANQFQFVNNTNFDNSRFIATINKNQTFVAGCNPIVMPGSDDRNPVKQIHILKYFGVKDRNGTEYFGFLHEAGYISDSIDCKFPEMVQHSLDIDFDISENYHYSEVWDHDWD